MKKILCGALLLIAAVAGFTGCKKNNNENGGKEGTGTGTITLTPTEISLTPGNTERVYAKFSGDNGTFTWTSENEEIATVSTNGIVTAMNYGTTNIVCTEKGGAKATCKVNVVTMLETFKSFPTASVSLATVKDSTMHDLFKIKLDDMEDSIMVRAYLAETAIRLFSEGAVYANGTGELTGPSTIAIIYIPAFVYYIDHTTCPEVLDEGEYVYNGLTSRYFETNVDTVANALVASIINEEAYWTHITAAFENYNNGVVQDFYKECGLASYEGFDGAALSIYEYDEERGYEMVSWMPDAVITRARIGLSTNNVYDYMYYVTGAVEIRPVNGDWGLGVYAEEDAFGKLTLKSEHLELGEPRIITLAVPQTEEAPARGKKVDMLSVKDMKLAPANIQLGRKVK